MSSSEYQQIIDSLSVISTAATSMDNTITEQGDIIIGQQGTIAQLQQALADCQGSHPPIGNIMKVGASVASPPTLNWTRQQCIDRWTTGYAQSDYGMVPHGPLGIRRVYSDGSFGSADANMKLDFNTRDSVISFKGEAPTQSQMTSFLNSLLFDKRHRYIVWQSEAENPTKKNTPAWFKAGCTQTFQLIDEWLNLPANVRFKPYIHKMIINMSWLDRDPDPKTSTQQWWPDIPLTDITLGLDPYNKKTSTVPISDLVTPTLKTWFARGGKMWGITEHGTHVSGAAGAVEVKSDLQWCYDNGASMFCWYHSSGGTDGPWWLSDPAMVAVWASEAARYNAMVTSP